MIALSGLVALSVAIGLYHLLSERSRKRLLGAGLLAQAMPAAVFLGGGGLPIAEALAMPALVFGLALFLALALIGGRGLDLHADEE